MYRIGTVLKPKDTAAHNGIRIISIINEPELGDTYKVTRIHYRYGSSIPEESWEMRAWQLERSNWEEIPIGEQLPLL